jgi:hypothetical protein
MHKTKLPERKDPPPIPDDLELPAPAVTTITSAGRSLLHHDAIDDLATSLANTKVNDHSGPHVQRLADSKARVSGSGNSK